MEKTSAWVLCPSKKFPGQYYYFNTRTGEKAWSWTVSSNQTPDKYVLSTSERPKAQASFGQINFPRYLHVSSPRQNQPIQNSLIKSNAVSLSHTPRSRETPQSRETPHSRESDQIVSTTTNTNFKLAPPHFKPVLSNPFSSSLPVCLHTDSRQLCEESASKKKVFGPSLNLHFPSKRRSDTDIDEINQRMKKMKIEAVSPKLPYISGQDNYLQLNPNKVENCHSQPSSSSPSTPERVVRNDKVKVSVHFLRNLSTLQQTEAWYLVPDVDVLLEDLTFIKEFMAGDRTCSLMIPAVVLAKLKSLCANCRAADSRATVAAQVFGWLTKNSVCQTDKLDECSLDDVTIHTKIIEYCLQADLFHVVIITKSKSLLNQARNNNIHAYYFDALKIIKQSENLFLLDPDSTNTLKLPTTDTPVNNIICNTKKNVHNNFEIRVNRNGKRLICNRPVNKNKAQKETSIASFFDGCTEKSLENNVFTLTSLDSEGIFVEDKLKKFCTKYAHFQNNVNERVDELICSFLQIMEHCLHNVLQRIPDTQFDPPCWLYPSLNVLKEHNSQNKQLCKVVERLIAMCGFRLNNGIMRPNIKPDQFIKILGVGILLIEQLEKIFQFPELSDCKEMLNELIADIQIPEDFPAETLLSLERRRRLGEDYFRTESGAEDGCCDFLVSNTETAPQHEMTTDMENHYARFSSDVQQISSDISEVFNDSGGSINLLQSKISDIGINCEAGPSGIRSEKNTPQLEINGDPVFQKLENTVDKIRHALTRMKQFIDVRMLELNNGGIPERRKEYLREKSNMFKECADKMFQILKMIQKRENIKDIDFGKKFAVRNSAYIDCVEHCLEQVEIIQTSFAYLLKALT